MTYDKISVRNIMKKNGFILDPNRGKGSHMVFRNGNRTISVGDRYNKMVIKRIIKENNLTV